MKRVFCLFCLIASFVLPSVSARAAALPIIRINEICSDNGGHYTVGDSAPDYIELYNSSDKALPLDGFYLSDDEDHLKKFSLDGYTVLKKGYLILAADKKELPFKLSASDGEELFLSDEDAQVLQHVILPPLGTDETYSLQKDGVWHVADPTPLEANAEGIPYVKKVYVASPRFSHEAGFYDEPFDLTLEGYKTYRLYYTTDGSIPDEQSTLYTGPIHIEDATNQPNTLSMRKDVLINGATPPEELVKKATIIRAVAIDPDGNRSNEVTNTYFVGFQNYEGYQNIPILSIVADPYELFDEQDGIYVRGKTYQEWLNDDNRNRDLEVQRIPTNYRMHGKKWEIPVSIQWFDTENTLRLSQNTGTRIHGNWSREQAKKSLTLYARKEYGSSTLQYDLLEGMTDKKRVIVRGNLGKDSVIHALLKETGIPVSASTPCLTFINGEFWGLYEIREKQDENDIAEYFGLSPKDLLVIKNKELDAGTEPEGTISTGVRAVYTDLMNEISGYSSAGAQGYNAISEVIDIDNYCTVMAGLTYLNNSDYRNAFTMWRTAEKGDGEYADGRWRWIFQDLDNCCYYYDGLIDIVTYLPEDVIFSALWKNNAFQTKFLTRVMDYANVELTPEYVQEFITPILTYYNPYLKETYIRYPEIKGSIDKLGTKLINDMTHFFKIRRNEMVQALTETFRLDRGTVTLTLEQLPDGIDLEINGHQAHIYGDSWAGVYFRDCAVRFVAGDIPGYRFEGWYEGDEMITAEPALEVSTDSDRTLTPKYTEISVITIMDKTEMLYGSGRFGFNIPIRNSTKECELLADETVEVKRSYIDNTITIQLDAASEAPQGFTLTVPLRDYFSVGGVFTLSMPDASPALKWRVQSRNGENPYQELAFDETALPGGRTRLSFFLPEEQLDNQTIVIRLEAEAEKGTGTFVLQGIRMYGEPMDASQALAYEYDRVVKSIGADARYAPDLAAMEGLSEEEIEAEIVALRNALQAAMIKEALTTVGAFGAQYPAWEGLETYPMAVIDEKLIKAFYNDDAVHITGDLGATLYVYEVTDGDTLRLEMTEDTDGSGFWLFKRAGTFLLLDRPLEEIRFSVSFNTAEIPESLFSTVFYNIAPQNHLWMNIETFTRYQEEVPFDLPENWAENNVYIYCVEGKELVYATRKKVINGEFRFEPAQGSYLLLDEPLESFAKQAEWKQQEIADQQQIRAREEQKRAKTRNTLIIIGCALCAAVAAGAAGAYMIYRKRKQMR